MAEYDLDAIVAQRREAVGGDDIVFTYNGERFSIPHPLLADDEWKEELADLDGASDVDTARAMMGDEEYERFRAAGGRAGYVMDLLAQVGSELRDEDGSGRPTRRSTSSGNTRKQRKRR